jgi:hypothetical protein
MRDRFTPANACSTLTRTRDSFRFVRFSACVSFPRGGFFFRLPRFRDRWLVPLEAGVLIQHRSGWVGDALLIHDPFLVRLAHLGRAQETDLLVAGTDDHHVLVGVRLLLATVVQGLFFRIFRALATTFGPVDDQPLVAGRVEWDLTEVVGIPFRTDAQFSEGRLQDGQEPVNPVVHGRLAHAEEFGHHDLQRIGLQVDEDEQQLLLRRMQCPLAPATSGPLAGLACQGLVGGVGRLIGPGKGRQEQLKLRKGQPGEGQALPTITLDCWVGHHDDVVSLFPIKSIGTTEHGTDGEKQDVPELVTLAAFDAGARQAVKVVKEGQGG